MSYPQDITAERSRLMRDGKRGPALVSESLLEEDFTLTYNSDGQVETLVKTIRGGPAGAVWQRTSTFSYSGGKMVSKVDSLILLP